MRRCGLVELVQSRLQRLSLLAGRRAVAVIALQALLITVAMPFERQVIAVSLSAVLTMCWAGAISATRTRTRTLPGP